MNYSTIRFGALILFLAAGLATSGLEAAVIVDFEGVPHGTQVFSQYADRGVTFNNVTAVDYSQRVPAIPGFAHSGTKAAEQCWGREFCSVPFEMKFTQGQRRVKAWVGYSAPLTTSR